MTPTPAQFERLDRLARLAVLAEAQHHFGIDSVEYTSLANKHAWLLKRSQSAGEQQ
jgi:hypothetical protein